MIDDLQWADPGSVRLLEILTPVLAGRPVTLLGTATWGPPLMEFATFLTGAFSQVQETREELLDDVRIAAGLDSADVELMLLLGLMELGWIKALDAAETRTPPNGPATRPSWTGGRTRRHLAWPRWLETRTRTAVPTSTIDGVRQSSTDPLRVRPRDRRAGRGKILLPGCRSGGCPARSGVRREVPASTRSSDRCTTCCPYTARPIRSGNR